MVGNVRLDADADANAAMDASLTLSVESVTSVRTERSSPFNATSDAAERCDRLPSTDASVADGGDVPATAALCLSGLFLAEFRALLLRFCLLVGDAVEVGCGGLCLGLEESLNADEESLTSATTVVLRLVSGDPPPKSVDPVCLIDPGLLLCWSKLFASEIVAMASWMTAAVLGVVAVFGFGAEEAAACRRDLFDVCNVLTESSPDNLPVGFRFPAVLLEICTVATECSSEPLGDVAAAVVAPAAAALTAALPDVSTTMRFLLLSLLLALLLLGGDPFGF